MSSALVRSIANNTIANKVSPAHLEALLGAGLLGGVGTAGVIADGFQDDEQSLIDNALLQTLGTGALASGVGASLGYASANHGHAELLRRAEDDLMQQKVRAQGIQSRSPGADMSVPMRNVANASNRVKSLRDPELLTAVRGRSAGRAMGVTAAGAALINLIDALRNESPAPMRREETPAPNDDRGLGTGLLIAAGASPFLAMGFDDMDEDSPQFYTQKPGEEDLHPVTKKYRRKAGL